MVTGGADLPWWPEEKGQRVERQPLSRRHIVEAAIRLIDRDGLDALSMRGLADELAAGAASRLYGHVRNKAELLVLVVDALAGEINEAYESRSATTWREHSTAFARAVRLVVCEAHPRAAVLFLPRMGLGPNVLRGMEELLGALRGAELEGAELYQAYWAVLTYAYGASIREAGTAVAGAGPGVEAPDLAAVLPQDRFPNVVAVAPAIAASNPGEQFDYGLQRLLDGIELANRAGKGVAS